MGTKIKICGLKTPQDIQCVNNYQPDYIGFVFAPSKRQIDSQKAERLKGLLNPTIQAIGVFVNAPLEEIIALVQKGVIEGVQLHGDEDEHYILSLKRYIEVPVIKAIRVNSLKSLQQQFELYRSYPLEHILIEGYMPKSYGGNGVCFNWDYLEAMHQPYFLAGGIHLHNLEEALKRKPYGIDVSSGVETNGVKDSHKIKAIIERVRR